MANENGETEQTSEQPAVRRLRYDTLAVSAHAEAEFWKQRALLLQDDLHNLMDKHIKLEQSYDSLKKNSSPRRPPASPTEPVTEA